MLVAGIFLQLAHKLAAFVIAAIVMGMGPLTLGQAASQGFRVNRFLRGLKAGIGMHMLQHLCLAADEIAVCIEARGHMLMKHDLFLIADQLRFCLFRRLGRFFLRPGGFRADQFSLLGGIALVGMGMYRQGLERGIAVLAVGVSLDLR